tara:strand:- start:1078 stop:1371 length:294 start_codon:yes stop_codon:yes gene_type:complete
LKAKKTGASIKSVINLIIIKINNIDAFLIKIAIRKASPIARFLATYSPEFNETSDPKKNEGLIKAIYGPTNIGQISMKRIITNHQVKVIFLFTNPII